MPESKQKAHVMSNEDVIDEFSAAVAAIVTDAPREKVERLARAVGSLLEALASKAAVQSASAFTAVYAELKRELAQTNRRLDRRKTKAASLESVVEDLRDRIVILEKAVGGHNGGH